MCGVFGVFGHPEAANITYLGLHALQHRGQESAGIVSVDNGQLHSHPGMGRVADVFDEPAMKSLPGNAAIGHVRYSTAGTPGVRNAQPFTVRYAHGSVAVAHNGNLVNALQLRSQLEQQGSIFQTDADTEVFVHLLAQSKETDIVERMKTAMLQVEGAYSVLFITESRLIAARDPWGFRPLALGRLNDSFVFASESCAFALVEAEFIRELEPGEIVVVDENGLQSYRLNERRATEDRFCVFEHIYFARPDSRINGQSVHGVRERLGRRLAKEHPVEADVVVPVPDSGVAAAIGYARQSGIPYDMGLIRSHYVGRTFIEPQQSIRHFGVKLKLSAVREVLENKRVVVVDDSIVRGTTSRKIVKMLRSVGVKEVHVRISSPPSAHPCFYGIDTPSRKELIGSSHTVDEISRFITSDSLGYLSPEGLMDVVGAKVTKENNVVDGEGFCSACFSGQYPVSVDAGNVGKLIQLRPERSDSSK